MSSALDLLAQRVEFRQALRCGGDRRGRLEEAGVAGAHCNDAEVELDGFAGFGGDFFGIERRGLVFDVQHTRDEGRVGEDGALAPIRSDKRAWIDPDHLEEILGVDESYLH